jgi:hypothetical protein
MKKSLRFVAGFVAAAGVTYAVGRRRRSPARVSLALVDGSAIDLAPSSAEALELRVAAAAVRRAFEASS